MYHYPIESTAHPLELSEGRYWGYVDTTWSTYEKAYQVALEASTSPDMDLLIVCKVLSYTNWH